MNCLSWNCRGLGNPRTIRELHHLVKTKVPNFVFLMETKCRRNKVEKIRNQIGFHQSYVVDNRGLSGDLAFLWKDGLEVELETYTRWHISLSVKLPEIENGVTLTWFYGSPEPSKRRGSWELLRALKPQNTNAWLCLGNFNEIMDQSEKLGAAERPYWQMENFREAVEECDLSEIHFHEEGFTWNGRDEETRVQRRPFKYEASWGCREDCAEIISRVWTMNPIHQPSVQELKAIQESNVGEDNVIISNLKKDIDNLLEEEDLKWKQRAKQQWLKEGDRNTSFFHKCANQRRKVNTIQKIMDENESPASTPKEVSQVFQGYFQNLFTSSKPENIEACTRHLQSPITNLMNDSLTRRIDRAEIEKAVFSMKGLGSPGPDGFPTIFYQNHWEVVSSQVCAVVQNAFQSSCWPREFNATHIALIPKTKNPTKVTEYRPISLCNVIYKILAKVLANRLKKFLPSVISQAQSAFVPGRPITDNIIVAFEALHSMQGRLKGKEGYMALKLDMSKAYDRIEWVFLEAVMRKMGITQHFWWGQNNTRKKIHWCSWEKVGLAKSGGGVGFRNFENFNLAMLAKQGWRLLQNPTSLAAQVLSSKYFPDGAMLKAKLGNNPSLIWRSIMAAKPLLEEGLIWRIGNGCSTKLWHDRWLPSPISFKIQSRINTLEGEAKVAEIIE
ncbi:uncharacterized protein LOC122304645 [Carya illinoinensis]|uniref:uncharacterized protein LOC122304645 n=1 Tax=Carya illinoinensis TaxID=32201 RepID=UPI001C724BB5|nr:uncharacterized protein LOC122304645 [Carya illinoinensis]